MPCSVSGSGLGAGAVMSEMELWRGHGVDRTYAKAVRPTAVARWGYPASMRARSRIRQESQ